MLGGNPTITDGQAHVILGHPLLAEVPLLETIALLPPSPPVGALDELPDNWCGCPGCITNGR